MNELLQRLAGEPAGFTAAQIARKGWSGIRKTADAHGHLEALADAGFLQRLTPNRQGQTRYAFTREEPIEERVYWAGWERGVLEADNLRLGADDDGGGETAFSIMHIPADADAGEVDLQKLGLALATPKITKLHYIAEQVRAGYKKPLSQLQMAFVLSLAQERIDPEFAPLPQGRPTRFSVPQSNDPRPTHMRGVARHLRMRYQNLLRAVAIAESVMAAATREPTMELDAEKAA